MDTCLCLSDFDFQELQKQSGYYQAEADWLNRTLKELSGFDGTEDVKMNEDRLVALLHQQQDLKPNMEKTLIVSATVTECHVLKEAVEKHLRRLSEIASVFREDGGISDLNSGRLLLAEQEVAYFMSAAIVLLLALYLCGAFSSTWIGLPLEICLLSRVPSSPFYQLPKPTSFRLAWVGSASE